MAEESEEEDGYSDDENGDDELEFEEGSEFSCSDNEMIESSNRALEK